MSRTFVRTCIALALLAALPAHRARAGDWTLTPSLGEYVPATRLSFDVDTPLIIQVEPATVIGGALTWRHSPRLAAEASVGYGRGKLNAVGGTFADFDEAFVNTDALARWSINADPTPVRWELLLGVGAYRMRGTLADLIRFRGYPGTTARTRLSVIGGLGASWSLGNGLALRIDTEDHMHGPGIESEDGLLRRVSRAVQHDVSMTVGVELPL